MEVWINERRPEVMCMANVTIAFVVHVAVVLGFCLFAYVHLKPKETVIPIALTFTKSAVEMSKPLEEAPTRPVDVPAISQSSVSQKEITGAKAAVVNKPVKPIVQKKTRAEREKEQIERIRRTARQVEIKEPAPSVNECAVERRMTEVEARNRLGEGEPHKVAQLGMSMLQSCVARVQMAINARWAQVNPHIPADGEVQIAVRFNAIGRMVDCRIVKSCGNKASDDTALMVVQTVGPIPGLDKEFLREFRHQDLIIRYTVLACP